jgi:hypothetical protein
VLPAGEGQELLGQLGAALRRSRCRLHHLAELLVGPEPHLDKFKIAQDRCEQVVEVVREAAGQLPQDLHSRSPTERILSRLALPFLSC